MYQILCDGFVLYDPRDEALSVKNKKCKIGSNICGEASFLICANHPHYGILKKLRSVFEIKQDNETIFRGRMTGDTRDFDNMKDVDLEGAMAYLNDSIIRPFEFPGNQTEAYFAPNVVEFFLRWLIDQHNSQVEPFQQFKVGKVTVKDDNNSIVRSSTEHASTWATIKSKLIDSSLGGYLCIRYEADGNYLDYLADYVDDDGNMLVNSQPIKYGENLVDFSCESDGHETYTAIVPLWNDGSTLFGIDELDNRNVTDDIVKSGDMLYSKSGVEKYGWICAPPSETTFDDVTSIDRLLWRGVGWLKEKSEGFTETTTLTAMDLHLTDDEIESFRVYRYVEASSSPHETAGFYPLSVLDIDMDNLQNTKITVGETKRTLTESNRKTETRLSKAVATVSGANASHAEAIGAIEQRVDDNEANIESVVKVANDNTKSLAAIEQRVGVAEANIESVVEVNASNTNSIASIQQQVDRNSAGISLKASKADVNAELELKVSKDKNDNLVGSLHIGADQLTIDSDNFKLDKDGYAEMTGATFESEKNGYSVNISDGIVTTVSPSFNSTVGSAVYVYHLLMKFTVSGTTYGLYARGQTQHGGTWKPIDVIVQEIT